MGMLDFLKHDPEDDYDDFDDDLLDDDMPEDDLDDEPEKSRPKKARKPLLRFTKEEEEETIELTAKARSRFSEDYQAYLLEQAERANENLRRRTAEAYELVRQAAGQPLPEGMETPVISPAYDEEEDAYIPGADEVSRPSDDFDEDDEYDDRPGFDEFDDDLDDEDI